MAKVQERVKLDIWGNSELWHHYKHQQNIYFIQEVLFINQLHKINNNENASSVSFWCFILHWELEVSFCEYSLPNMKEWLWQTNWLHTFLKRRKDQYSLSVLYSVINQISISSGKMENWEVRKRGVWEFNLKDSIIDQYVYERISFSVKCGTFILSSWNFKKKSLIMF